jgi:hypothetical protein
MDYLNLQPELLSLTWLFTRRKEFLRQHLYQCAGHHPSTIQQTIGGFMTHTRVANLSVGIGAALCSTLGCAADLTPVPQANTKVVGISVPNVLSSELREVAVAQGSTPLENPAAGFTSYYGYDDDVAGSVTLPMVPGPNSVQSSDNRVERTKTEPDKNVYLILNGQHGADRAYDYGTRFLYQGHEAGIDGHGYITRINLDADAAHRVTLLADQDTGGSNLPIFDGITWNPFTRTLLLTSERGNAGGVWEATVDFPSSVVDRSGSLGRGGYEGIQNDSDGNIWIVEDVGGAKGSVNKNARQPNSFIYRFVPDNPSDLSRGGRLQALQVLSIVPDRHPIVFHEGQADTDILSQDVRDLHTYGKVFETRWVTLHDTATDGSVPFDANALAKAKLATPFKRPENGQFRPGAQFREFYFDTTGDTDINTEAGKDFGGFGAVFKLVQQRGPSSDRGVLTLFYLCDAEHTGFDNVAFWSKDDVVFVEDAGDTLHTQRNALDSAYLFDVSTDFSKPKNQPVRILAEGRDPSATIDSALLALGNGFQNDGDNEITGIHVSDGDPSVKGLLGAKPPHVFKEGWRVFFTQQHGDNITWEIIPSEKDDE